PGGVAARCTTLSPIPAEVSPASRNGCIASIAANSMATIISLLASTGSSSGSDGLLALARCGSATVKGWVPLVAGGTWRISTSFAKRSAAQIHRVQFFDHPLCAIIPPEWLALNDEGRHTENRVALGFGASLVEIRRPFAFRVLAKICGIETDLG